MAGFLDKLLGPILAPFRSARSSYLNKKNMVGNIKVDVNRAKAMGSRAKQDVAGVNNKLGGGLKQAPQAGIGAGAAAPPQPGAVAPPAAIPPPVKKKGGFMGLFGKKKSQCPQCGQMLDPSWDQCPYCIQAAQAAQAAAAAAAPAAPAKTQAFFVEQGGGGAPALLGWLVPIKGQQRGELFTLKAMSSIGTDPACDVVLNDPHMSRRHAEIKFQNGSFWLVDLGSTNGTFVNDKKVTQPHELVDSDNVKFGQTPVKFKSL